MKTAQKDLLKILVIGQTPPPFGGQAVMIEKMLRGVYQRIEFVHVRMHFSDEMDEIGKFQLEKIRRLFDLIIRTWRARFQSGATILYYPPAGPNVVPFLRDVIFLGTTRWLFSKTVFHFHATGVSEAIPQRSLLFRLCFNFAYGKPDLTIGMTGLGPKDHLAMKSKRHVIVPHGVEDIATGRRKETHALPPSILFVGVVGDEKGAGILLEACRLLKKKCSFICTFVGRFASPSMEKTYREFVTTQHLENHVRFPGVLVGDAKWQAYREADIFCFPSHFPSESFPVVLLEAMQFSLPVVSTQWKGIPSIVEDAKTGCLVPTHDPGSVASRLLELIENSELRKKLGEGGRKKYETEYQLATFFDRLDNIFASLAD